MSPLIRDLPQDGVRMPIGRIELHCSPSILLRSGSIICIQQPDGKQIRQLLVARHGLQRRQIQGRSIVPFVVSSPCPVRQEPHAHRNSQSETPFACSRSALVRLPNESSKQNTKPGARQVKNPLRQCKAACEHDVRNENKWCTKQHQPNQVVWATSLTPRRPGQSHQRATNSRNTANATNIPQGVHQRQRSMAVVAGQVNGPTQ
mmetsp:Transcript_35777/g.93666  ORF Transcript_35777/g.93666 Transcript_35777/m.93666 type:complete len:204 (+) Transcript_35777:1097-1708(+)